MSASAPTATHAHPLSDEQQAFFKEHGYVVLRGFASQQVSAALLAAAQDGLASAAAPVELETDVGYAGAPTSREAEGARRCAACSTPIHAARLIRNGRATRAWPPRLHN